MPRRRRSVAPIRAVQYGMPNWIGQLSEGLSRAEDKVNRIECVGNAICTFIPLGSVDNRFRTEGGLIEHRVQHETPTGPLRLGFHLSPQHCSAQRWQHQQAFFN